MLEDILSQGFQALSIPFTAETLSAFSRYTAILAERNRQMNLTAITSEDEVARLIDELMLRPPRRR